MTLNASLEDDNISTKSFLGLPLRKGRSTVVKKSLMSKASKVTQSDVDAGRVTEATSGNKVKIRVKAIGIGRRRSIFSRKNSTSKDGSCNTLETTNEEFTSTDARSVNNEDERTVDTAQDNTREQSESVLTKAGNAADATIMFIGENVHKVVLSVVDKLDS
jgi:hypothetical protein